MANLLESMDNNFNINNTPTVPGQTVNYQDPTIPPKNRRFVIFLIILIALAIVGAGLLIIYLNNSSSQPSSSAPETLTNQNVDTSEVLPNPYASDEVLFVKTVSSEDTISIENAEEAEEYIEASGVLDKRYPDLGGGSFSIKKVIVALSSAESDSSEEVFNAGGQKIATVSMIFIFDRLEIHVNPDPAYATDNEKIGEAMSLSFVQVIESLVRANNQAPIPVVQPIFRVE